MPVDNTAHGKRPPVFYILISFLLTAMVFTGFFLWQKQKTVYRTDTVFRPSGSIDRVAFSAAQHGATATCTAALEVSPEEVRNYKLVFFRFQNLTILSADKGADAQSAIASGYRRVHAIPLSAFQYDPDSRQLSASWESDASYFKGSVYLMPAEVFRSWEQLCSALSYLTLGFVLLMTLYSIFLFACKPDEYYLTDFYVFCVTLLIIVTFNTLPFGMHIHLVIYQYLQPFMTMVHTGVGLLASYDFIMLQQQKRKMHSLIVFGAAILYAVIMNTFGGVAAEFLRLVCLLLVSALLIQAASGNLRGAAVLLICHSLRLGTVLAQMAVNLGLLEDWFEFTMLRSTAFIEIPFAIAFMFCITQRFADKFRESEQLTQKLSEFNQQLDEKVQLRTKQYRQEQELRHNMMLNVFHDLRTPLFTVKGCMDILSDKLEDEKELVDVMKHRLAFASELTESLFLQAKLEDNDWIIPFSRHSLKELLGSVCQAMALEAEQKHMQFTYDIPSDVFLWANEEQLQRAFQNLIINSIHYTPEGGRVTVHSAVTMETVRITISDTGKGMTVEDLAQLFTRFYRASNHTDSYSTGLGLSIAQSVIARHKGTIEVESAKGKGTSMTVVLPILQTEETTEA